jgi:pimeloyl-ACP methyl ester carboxylesterase
MRRINVIPQPIKPMGISSGIDILVPEFTNVRVGFSYAKDSRFFENYTLNGRVSAATMVIDHFLAGNHYEAIYIVGHSEGAQILPRVYRSLKSQSQINGLVLMSFGGMSQFEYFSLLYHKYGPLENTYLVNLKDYQDKIKRIQQDPLSIQKWWMGWPYRRWSSLGTYRPLDDLLLIDIPILLTHGTRDITAPVESSRQVVDEFYKAGKHSATLIEYADNDHSYNGEFNQVINDINEWISH